MADQRKRIAVFGAGYVGLVTGACFAELGHRVAVRDVIPERIETLRRGEVPIFEPGLDELLARNRERLSFTLDVTENETMFAAGCTNPPPPAGGMCTSTFQLTFEKL